MRNWSPKTRNYWGQKRRRDSTSTDQEENDASSTRPPMPWEPQDTTQEATTYRQDENSEYENYGNTPSLETIVITPEPSSPIWENGKSVIDTLKGKPPEDIDPQNFIQKIVKKMLGTDENSHQALNRRAPQILGADISGPMISADSPDGKGGRADVIDHGNTLPNIPKVLGNVITGPVISVDSPDGQGRGEFLREVERKQKQRQIQKPANYQNRIWPSGYIYPLPDSFDLYVSRGYYEASAEKKAHRGIDFVGRSAGLIKGQPILAIDDGEVIEVITRNNYDKNGGGLRVLIKSRSRKTGEYFIHNYMHMEAGSNDHIYKSFKSGMPYVKQGDIIGNVGSSNHETLDQKKNYHLHLQSTKIGHKLPFSLLQYFPEIAKLPKQPGSPHEWNNE
jgi:murein DD-endopeptidase MepM/ murein hydrolase activator NlpD